MAFNDARTMLLRAAYIAWLVHFAVALGSSMLCVEVAVLGGLGPSGVLEQRDALLLAFGALNFPVSLMLRRLGLRHAHFAEQEAFFEECFGFGPSSCRPYARQLERLVARIANTRGWERQQARRLAKRWLARVQYRLDDDERAAARAQLGYLWPRR